eukprot:PhM_4_TR1258/c0_g1_i1/m.81252
MNILVTHFPSPSKPFTLCFLFFVVLAWHLPAGTSAAAAATQTGISSSTANTGATIQPLDCGARPSVTTHTSWPSGWSAPNNNEFFSAAYDGTYVWLAPYRYDKFVRVQKHTTAVTEVIPTANVPALVASGGNYRGAVFDGTYVWYSPMRAKTLLRVHHSTLVWETFDMPTLGGNADHYAGVVYTGSHLYFPPFDATSVLRVDPATMQQWEISGFPSSIVAGNSAKFCGGVYDGTNVWLCPYTATRLVSIPPGDSPVMVGYDMPGGFGSRGSNLFSSIIYDGSSRIWLIPQDSNVLISVHKTTGSMDMYTEFPPGFSLVGQPLGAAAFDGRYIWTSKTDGSALLQIETSTGNMAIFTDVFPSSSPNFIHGVINVDLELWFLPLSSSTIARIGCANHTTPPASNATQNNAGNKAHNTSTPALTRSATVSSSGTPTHTATDAATDSRIATQTADITVTLPQTVSVPLSRTQPLTLTLDLTNSRTLRRCHFVNCGAHGECDEQTASCTCHQSSALGFYSGELCDQCASGFSGELCRTRDGCVEGSSGCAHGTCVGTTCVCHANSTHGYWDNEACSICAADYYGADCTTMCNVDTCGAHGTCSSTGSCLCSANATHGFWSETDNCKTCAKDYYGASCTTHCSAATTCNGHGTCDVNGMCVCSSSLESGFWNGTGCDVCQTDVSGPNCRTSLCLSPLPTPTVTFTEALDGVTVNANDLGNAQRLVVSQPNASALCKVLLQSNTLALLGVDPQCVWSSSATLLIMFGATPTFTLVSPVTFLAAGMLFVVAPPAGCSGNVLFDKTTVTVMPNKPPSHKKPVAVLSSSSTSVTYCANVAAKTQLVLDGSTSVVDSIYMKYRYRAIAVANVTSADLGVLSEHLTAVSASSQTASIPMTLLQPRNASSVYTFILELMDEVMLEHSLANVTVRVAMPEATDDNLVLTAQSLTQLQTQVSSSIVMRVAVEVPACVSVDHSASYRYSWSVESPSPVKSWNTLALTRSFLEIPEYSLEPGHTYVFTSTATRTMNGKTVTAQQNFTVTALTSPLRVSVSNATQFTVVQKQSNSFVLNVSLVCSGVDPDHATQVVESFAWECANENGTFALCPFRSVASELESATDRTMNLVAPIPTSYLVSSGLLASPGQKSLFLVRVKYSKGTARVAHSPPAVVSVVVLPDDGSTGAAFSLDVAGAKDDVMTSARYALQVRARDASSGNAVPQSQLTFSWSVSPPLDLSTALTGVHSDSLVLPPYTLGAAGMYVFTVAVSRALPGQTKTYETTASINVKIHAPPNGGNLTAAVTSARALDEITLHATGWLPGTSSSSSPLDYAFFLIDETGEETLLSPFAPTPSRSVRVPRLSDGATLAYVMGGPLVLQALVVVRDGFGASSRAAISFFLENLSASASAQVVVQYQKEIEMQVKNLVTLQNAEGALELLAPIASAAADEVLPTTISLGFQALALPSSSVLSLLEAQLVGGLSVAANSTQLRDSRTTIRGLVRRGAFDSTNKRRHVDASVARNLLGSLSRLGDLFSAVQKEATSGSRRDDVASTVEEVRTNVNLAEALGNGLMVDALAGETRAIYSSGMTMTCGGFESSTTGSASSATISVFSASERLLALCSAEWPVNIFAAATSRNVTSTAHSIVLIDQSTGLVVQSGDTQHSLNVTFALERTVPMYRMSRTRCGYFDYDVKEYSTRGCYRLNGNSAPRTECRCTHLTDFSLLSEAFSDYRPNINLDIGNFEDIKHGGIIYVSVMAAIVAFAAFIGFCVDQWSQIRLIRLHHEAITAAHNVSSHSSPLCERRKSTMTPGLIQMYLRNPSTFPRTAAECRASVHAKDPEAKHNSVFGVRSILRKAASFHPWLSPFVVDNGRHFTVSQRIWLVGCLTMSALFYNAVFFVERSEGTSLFIGQLLLALLCIVATTPIISFSVSFFFARTGRTFLDAGSWYVPKDEDGNPYDLPEPAGATQEVLELRLQEDVPQLQEGDPIVLTSQELDSVADVFYKNNQGLLYISTYIARNLENERFEQSTSGKDNDVVVAVRSTVTRRESFKKMGHRRMTMEISDGADLHNVASGPNAPFGQLVEEVDTDGSVPQLVVTMCDEVPKPPTVDIPSSPSFSPAMSPSMAPASGQTKRFPNPLAVSMAASLCASPRFNRSGFMEPCTLMAVASDDSHFIPVMPTEPIDEVLLGSPHRDPVKATIIPVAVSRNLVVSALSKLTNDTYNAKDPFFAKHKEKLPLLDDMWGLEAERVPWKLAIEAVKLKEFALAECMFDFGLLIENADSFYVLYSAPPPRDLGELLETIVSAAGNRKVHTIARSWAQYYAAIHLHMSPADYLAAAAGSEVPTPNTVSMLLGIHHGASNIFSRYGCVPYAIFEETIDTIQAVKHPQELLRESPVVATHLIRLHHAAMFDPEVQTPREKKDSFRAATSMSSADTIPSKTLDELLSTAAKRSAQVGYRYTPYEVKSNLQLPTFLPPTLRDRLLLEDRCHTCFKTTIEFARFCALYYAKAELGISFNEFSRMYRSEEKDIINLGPRLGVQRHPKEGWAHTWDMGTIPVAHEGMANNLVPPVTQPRTTTSPENEYLTYIVNFKVTRNVAARFVCSHVSHDEGVSVLSGFHPPRMQGTGSLSCPHVGWAALEEMVRVEDTVFALPGTYPVLSWTGMRCPADRPIIICGLGSTGTGRDGEVRIENDLQQTSKKRIDALVQLDACSYLRFTGFRLVSNTDGANVGVSSLNGRGIVFEDCVFECQVLYSADSGEFPVPLSCNQHYGNTVNCLRRFLSTSLPQGFVAVGYLYVLILFAAFALGTLFATADMTTGEAEEWVVRSVISVAVKVVLVAPAMCVMRTVYFLAVVTARLDVANGGAGVDMDFSFMVS